MPLSMMEPESCDCMQHSTTILAVRVTYRFHAMSDTEDQRVFLPHLVDKLHRNEV